MVIKMTLGLKVVFKEQAACLFIHHLKHARGHLWMQPRETPVCRTRSIEKPAAQGGAGPGDAERRAAWLHRSAAAWPGAGCAPQR